jgi:hypothetical protein
MRKSAKNVSQGKGHALSRPPSGGLTCSESQVDDMFSAGESTENERIYPAKQTEQKPIASSRARQPHRLVPLVALDSVTH